jgi:ribonuclease R
LDLTILERINNNLPLETAQIESIADLIQAKLIKIENKKGVLSSLCKIGYIELVRNHALLKVENGIEKFEISFDSLNGAKDGDLVIAKKIINPRLFSKAKVIKILRNSDKPTLIFYKDFSCYLFSHPQVKVEFQSDKLMDFDVAIVDLSKNEILKFLGNINDNKIDEEVSLFLYGEEYRLADFGEFEMPQMDCERVDLTHLPFCTIDPVTAKDHDDAIYYDVESNKLFVAIADVSHFVKPGTKLDEIASKRAVSLYFPHKVLPMLPPILSENMCSLRPNELKLAFVFEIFFDENFEVKSSKLYEAKIISQAKFSYEEIDKLIRAEIDENTHSIFQSLVKFYRVSAILRKRRLKNGFDFESEELRLVLDNDYDLKSINVETSSPSHSLVEEAMLLANTEAAKLLKSKGIFRNHPEPSSKSIDKVANELESIGIKTKNRHEIHKFIESAQKMAKGQMYEKEINELLIKSQQLAVYGFLNIGHFGLGFKSYSHFTSPIRRYADLVLHRILKSKIIPKNINEICEHINLIERRVDDVVWDFEERKFARWAKDNINLGLNVMITDAQKGAAKTISPLYGIRVWIEDYDFEQLFSRIDVKISSVDLISKKINVKKG